MNDKNESSDEDTTDDVIDDADAIHQAYVLLNQSDNADPSDLFGDDKIDASDVDMYVDQRKSDDEYMYCVEPSEVGNMEFWMCRYCCSVTPRQNAQHGKTHQDFCELGESRER